ncbi:MAG: prepilin-type N-terminal cleavage/methylation domain-containing protein [Akkermansiaceae bacterium]|nr:prepilin-type N-terminal cleavage/methylation domain-containing protein [Akkermansiaceae bacterium]
MRNSPSFCQARVHASGYSLLELLVVISLIAVLMTVGSFGIKNFSKASGVSSGVPIAQGVFAQARALAIEKGTNTRVMMHCDNRTDSLNRERNLRYMVVQYEDTKNTEVTTDDEWVTASKGVKLPEGVFYSVSLSNRTTAPDTTLSSGPLPGGAVQNCRVYEFNSQGIITSPVPVANNVPRFVIRAGSLPPGQTEPIPASGAGERNVGGFVIWRNGRTSVFRHPDQVFF